jgi:hypothetical protein
MNTKDDLQNKEGPFSLEAKARNKVEETTADSPGQLLIRIHYKSLKPVFKPIFAPKLKLKSLATVCSVGYPFLPIPPLKNLPLVYKWSEILC